MAEQSNEHRCPLCAMSEGVRTAALEAHKQNIPFGPHIFGTMKGVTTVRVPTEEELIRRLNYPER